MIRVKRFKIVPRVSHYDVENADSSLDTGVSIEVVDAASHDAFIAEKDAIIKNLILSLNKQTETNEQVSETLDLVSRYIEHRDALVKELADALERCSGALDFDHGASVEELFDDAKTLIEKARAS